MQTLVSMNLRWLAQAGALLDRLSGEAYTSHRIGNHMRHILEFYECLLDGLGAGLVDYDNRRRDAALENSREEAKARVGLIAARLRQCELLNSDRPLRVRMEDAGPDQEPLLSSIGRELQSLSSHTVHHFAIMAFALQSLDVPLEPDFGVAPSTLRYRASLRQEAA